MSFPVEAHASLGLIKPTSKLYFLQSWGESIKLFLTTSNEGKFNYLLELADRRVDEANLSPEGEVLNRYNNQMSEAAVIAGTLTDKQNAIQRVSDASLRHQEALARVYVRVPDQAKEAILGAQTQSSKHIQNTISVVAGENKAQDYANKAASIQQAEQVGKVQQVEMEGEPSGNPSEQNINPINEGQGLNQLNPINDQNGGSGGLQPAAPVPMR